MTAAPKVNSSGEKELDKCQKQFDAFDANVRSMTLDHMNKAPKMDVEQQTKLSSGEIDKDNNTWLKPHRSVGSKEKFNEAYRDEYNFVKEYVNFTAENLEIIGETIDMWTKPFAGMPAEWWKIPVNKPVWAPRYVAEQIKRASYHKMTMSEKQMVGEDQNAQYYGSMAVGSTVQRLNAIPVSSRKSIFMGANSF